MLNGLSAKLRMPGVGMRSSSMGSNPMRGLDRLASPRLGVQRRLIPNVRPKRIIGGLTGSKF